MIGSALGERVFGNLVAGKKAQVGGSLSQPHSFAYIEDVGRAAAELGVARRRARPGLDRAARAGADAGADGRGGVRVLGIAPAVSAVSPLMMRLAGLFIPGAKESVEMMYEFTTPFVVDSRADRARAGAEGYTRRRRARADRPLVQKTQRGADRSHRGSRFGSARADRT